MKFGEFKIVLRVITVISHCFNAQIPLRVCKGTAAVKTKQLFCILCGCLSAGEAAQFRPVFYCFRAETVPLVRAFLTERPRRAEQNFGHFLAWLVGRGSAVYGMRLPGVFSLIGSEVRRRSPSGLCPYPNALR